MKRKQAAAGGPVVAGSSIDSSAGQVPGVELQATHTNECSSADNH